MRTLSKTLSCLQGAIDRAYLDNKHGNVWKYARMSSDDYPVTEFLVQPPEEGGYILKFVSTFSVPGNEIFNRLKSAIFPPYEKVMEEGEIEVVRYKEKIVERKAQLHQKGFEIESYEGIMTRPGRQMIRRYGDRSIVKEIDQMLAPVRASSQGNNIIELTFHGENSIKFSFDKIKSQRFHLIVSQKDLGEPVIYKAKVRSLDNQTLKGKIFNVDSRKEASVHFFDEEDFLKVHPFLARKEEEMQFIGSPLIEYGAFDPNAGDIYFLDLFSEHG